MTGAHGALGDRGQKLLVPNVLDLVAVELAQRVAHDRLLVDLGEDGVEDQGDGPADEQQSDEQFDVVHDQISMLMMLRIQRNPTAIPTMAAPNMMLPSVSSNSLLM